MTDQASIPSLLAILLCDQVIIDQATGKKTLVGLFNDMLSPSEPLERAVGFYARLTDLEGIYSFDLKVVRIAAEGEIVVARGKFGVEQPITDRLADLEIALNLPPTRFPTFGKYEFQLFANEMYVGRAVLNCRKQEAASQ